MFEFLLWGFVDGGLVVAFMLFLSAAYYHGKLAVYKEWLAFMRGELPEWMR